MKKIFYLLIAIGFCNYSFGQIKLNSTSLISSATSFAFLDGVSTTYAGANFAGNGILFPRTDLTTVTGGSVTAGANHYDGVVVYNTGTGAIPASAMGTSVVNVAPGFYYYSNPSASATRPTVNIDTGVWTPMGGGGGATKVDISATATDTNITTLEGTGTTKTKTDEKVISLTASADGTNAELTLAAAITGFNRFRGAKIYNTSGNLVLETAGSYNNTTKKLGTSNGAFSVLFPATSSTTLYTVEFYFN